MSTRVIQRTPNVGIKIRLQRAAEATQSAPAIAAAPAPAGAEPQLAWTAVEHLMYWTLDPPTRGEIPGGGDWANLHEWRQGDDPITPVALVTVLGLDEWGTTNQDPIAIATVFNAPPGAVIDWAITLSHAWTAEIVGHDLGVPGVSCTVRLLGYPYYSPNYDVHSLTLTATVNDQQVGSLQLFWQLEQSLES